MDKIAVKNKLEDTAPKKNKQSQEKFEVKSQFFALAVNMSWQLAIIVLVPIVGGFKLDQYIKTTPLFTIVGFIIAMAGTALTLKRILGDLNGTQSTVRGKK